MPVQWGTQVNKFEQVSNLVTSRSRVETGMISCTVRSHIGGVRGVKFSV